MKRNDDKRQFDRFRIDFVLKVYALNVDGKKFEDVAGLEDISGEGAKFLTQKSDMYFPGQLVKITILLPGTDEMEAYMKAKGIVVRVDSSNDHEKNNKSSTGSIAVKFETRFNFETIGI